MDGANPYGVWPTGIFISVQFAPLLVVRQALSPDWLSTQVGGVVSTVTKKFAVEVV